MNIRFPEIVVMPAWLSLLRCILSLVYPFTVVWAAVTLTTVNGPSFWILSIVLLLIFARPKLPLQ